MSDPPAVRPSQRTVLACTECVRRKIRCSKSIPCTSCVRHNKVHLCRREVVAVTTRRAATRRPATRGRVGSGSHPAAGTSTRLSVSVGGDASQNDEPHDRSRSSPGSILSPSNDRSTSEDHHPGLGRGSDDPLAISTELRPPELGGSCSQTTITAATVRPLEGPLTNESASALEFLAHGRQSVRQRFLATDYQSPSTPRTQSPQIPFDMYFEPALCRRLLDIQETHLAWMHTVVHMPTLKQEFEDNVISGGCSKSWAALYYAILAVSDYDCFVTDAYPRAIQLLTYNVLTNSSANFWN